MAIFNTIYGKAAPVEPEPVFEWWSPKMTSDNTPAPFVVSASSYLTQSGKIYSPFLALDNNHTTFFHSDNGDNEPWIQFDFGIPTTVEGVRFTAPGNVAAPNSTYPYYLGIPKLLSVLASNDGTNFDLILEETSPLHATPSPGDIQEHMFEVSSYRFYKFKPIENYLTNGAKFLFIEEMEFCINREATS